jgi:hypothetical protein
MICEGREVILSAGFTLPLWDSAAEVVPRAEIYRPVATNL